MKDDAQLIRVITAEPLDGFVLRLSFSDGSSREVNVEEFLRGPVFEPIRKDHEVFRQVRVESGAVVWPNGADIDPVVLHGSAKPAWKEDQSGARRGG